MKKIKLFVVAATMLLANAVSAQNVVSDSSKVEIPASFELLQTAHQLVEYGYETGTPLPLIQAASLYVAVNAQNLDATKNAEGEGTETTKQEVVSYDVDQLLADAAALAEGDANYLALIDGVKNSATRGAYGGPKSATERVNAHSTDVYRIQFRGNEEASVLVVGDGDTDLDLYIYDENGNLIDQDLDYGDTCLCTWYPAWTGYFTIKVKNLGNVYNRYEIITN